MANVGQERSRLGSASKALRVSACILVLATTRGARGDGQAEQNDVQILSIDFETDNGWHYDGRIEVPPKETRRAWAVMLLGGGMGTAIDWRVPGMMTLDGTPTRDADTITQALLDRGFVVMRWQAIRRGDPKFSEDGLMMDVASFEQTVEQAHKALAAFRAKNVVPNDRIFLIGHSLGAFRAAMLIAANKDVPGVVLLAGAKLVPSKLGIVRDIVAKTTADFDHQNLERHGAHARHEYITEALGQHREEWEKPVVHGQTKYHTPWPAHVIMSSHTPTLLIVGALDKRWVVESYLFTDYMRSHRHPDYGWHVYENLGHGLGPETPGDVRHEKYGIIAESRTGPIDKTVVQELVDWIDRRAK